VFGGLIERGVDHRRIFDVFGVTRDESFPGFGVEHLYPDAIPTLRTLRTRGLRVGLAGNTSEQIEDILRSLDLPADVIGSSARWGIEKPSRDFFERVIAEGGAAADETVYVGDRLDNDVIPAVEAGMIGVFLKRGPWAYLEDADADLATHRIDSLAELPELIS
jgi:HAD superfamily hydrolase (TIGR01549 family)